MAERALLSLESRNSDAGNQYGTMEADLTTASHNNSQCSEGAFIIDTQQLLDAHTQQLLEALDHARLLVKKWSSRVVVEEKRKEATRKRFITNVVTSNIVVITLVWQALSIGCLTVIDFKSDHTHSKKDLAAILVMAAFQSLQLALVFILSFKLFWQVLSHTASASLLTQTYVTTVFMFAGLYTLQYQIQDEAWRNVTTGYLHPFFLYIKMLYFSVSTATLCGASSIEPLMWYNTLTSCFQMLSSFVYFPTILSMAVKYIKFGSKKTRAACKRFGIISQPSSTSMSSV